MMQKVIFKNFPPTFCSFEDRRTQPIGKDVGYKNMNIAFENTVSLYTELRDQVLELIA